MQVGPQQHQQGKLPDILRPAARQLIHARHPDGEQQPRKQMRTRQPVKQRRQYHQEDEAK